MTRCAAGSTGCLRREDAVQGRSAQVRHADGRQARALVLAHRVDLDHVGVVEPAEGLRLAAAVRGNLDRDEAVAKVRLGGQEDPGERAAPQLAQQPEAEERLPLDRPGDRLALLQQFRIGGQVLVRPDGTAQRRLEGGEAGAEVVGVGGVASLDEAAVLVVGQVEGGGLVAPEVGGVIEEGARAGGRPSGADSGSRRIPGSVGAAHELGSSLSLSSTRRTVFSLTFNSRAMSFCVCPSRSRTSIR